MTRKAPSKKAKTRTVFRRIIKWVFIGFTGVIALFIVGVSVFFYKLNPTGIGVGKGAHRAETCFKCHPQHLKEWRDGMTAAFTAMKEPFLAGQAEEFAGPMCWKCHDPFKLGLEEGVTCEYCHGINGAPDEEGHKVYAERLVELKDESFCFKCHRVIQPITKADLQGTVQEWMKSPAKKEGLTCQGCHMPVIGEDLARHHFHGHYFPNRNPLPNRESLTIEEIRNEDENIIVFVKNSIRAHYLPSGAHTKALFLIVEGFDGIQNIPVFQDKYIFIKRFQFKKILGLQTFPFAVYMDTRLKPEEIRKIIFAQKSSLKIKKVVATIRCAFVGDLGFDPEYFTSDFIVKKEVYF